MKSAASQRPSWARARLTGAGASPPVRVAHWHDERIRLPQPGAKAVVDAVQGGRIREGVCCNGPSEMPVAQQGVGPPLEGARVEMAPIRRRRAAGG